MPLRVDKALKLEVVFILMFTLVITASTSASVYSQTTGDVESTKRWCEQKKDELKDRLTDLFLFLFIPSPNFNDLLDMPHNADVLSAEIASKSTDCADYLTGTEIRTMEGMGSAARFVACAGDIIINTPYY